ARPGIGALQQRDQLVRAGAADDARRVEPMMPPERLAQPGGAAIRVAVDLAGEGLVRGDRLRAGAERAFVRGEPDRPRHAFGVRLAADVRRNVEDARSGPRG